MNSQKMAAMFNLKDIRAGRIADPQVYGNDIIVVGESASRKFLKYFSSTFSVLGSFSPLTRSRGVPVVTH